jgi:hypothetical protein
MRSWCRTPPSAWPTTGAPASAWRSGGRVERRRVAERVGRGRRAVQRRDRRRASGYFDWPALLERARLAAERATEAAPVRPPPSCSSRGAPRLPGELGQARECLGTWRAGLYGRLRSMARPETAGATGSPRDPADRRSSPTTFVSESSSARAPWPRSMPAKGAGTKPWNWWPRRAPWSRRRRAARPAPPGGRTAARPRR